MSDDLKMSHAVKGGKRFGRVRPKARPLCLALENYLGAAASAPPAKSDWRAKAASALGRMYLNDRYGCCVISSKAHGIGVWTGNDTPKALEATDAEILKMYNRLKAGPGDSGCVISDVLNYMRANGLLLGGTSHKIDGYVSVNNTRPDVVMWGIHLFGGLCLGLNLPDDWTSNQVWDVTSSPIVGGHDVLAVAYDATGVYVSSWGDIYRITWPAFSSIKWVEEAYAVLAYDWYNADGISPSGFDVSALKSDLGKLGGGILPDVDVPPPPPPAGWKITIAGTGSLPTITTG